MLVTVLLTIAAITFIGGLLTVFKAGEKDNICDHDYTDN